MTMRAQSAARRACWWLLPVVATLASAGWYPSPAVGAPQVGQSGQRDEAVATVNAYRAMSGLAPLVADATWDAQARAHSCYQLANGATHDEVVGAPGYSTDGAEAGRSGNVAVSSDVGATPTDHVELWLTGPFHAIGLLRPTLVRTGFGMCTDAASGTVWRSAATMDVSRGIDADQPWPEIPVVFPGAGATVPLTAFVTERPDPLAACGWQAPAGLPLIVMMPHAVGHASATLTGPDGSAEVCVLHAGNVSDPGAASVLASANAVVVVPRHPLAGGRHAAVVVTDAGRAEWSFDIDPRRVVGGPPAIDLGDTHPLGPAAGFRATSPFRQVDTRRGQGASRLRRREVVEIVLGPAQATAISANFVAVAPDEPGFLTLFECGTPVPTVSNLGFGPGEVVANQVIVPVVDGRVCVFASAATDLVVDVNGYFEPDGPAGFVAVAPRRLLDTRTTARLRAGEERRLTVPGLPTVGRPATVALSVVAVDPAAAGHLAVTPCGAPGADTVSSINYIAGDLRPNVVVTPLDASGSVCLRSHRDVDVVVDLTGWFADSGSALTMLAPIRMLDTRQPHGLANSATDGRRLGAGDTARVPIAGVRGVPADARAVAVNITVVGAEAATFVTAFPCGERPATSTVNVPATRALASSGALVGLSDDGALCIYSKVAGHVIVDLLGVWRSATS